MRALIAGVGNIFAGDDGFGCAVASSLDATDLPPGVEVRDFGIRGVHLAYDLLTPREVVVIVDAVARGGEPGTLYVIEHAADPNRPPASGEAPMLDAHDMSPDEVLALVPLLGGTLTKIVIVGCEPAVVEPGMGLSPAVAARVADAAKLALEITHDFAETTVSATRTQLGGA